MKRLIQRVLGFYIPIQLVKSSLDDLASIPHTDRAQHLSDKDIFIGNEARVLVSVLADESTPEQLSVFFRYIQYRICTEFVHNETNYQS